MLKKTKNLGVPGNLLKSILIALFIYFLVECANRWQIARGSFCNAQIEERSHKNNHSDFRYLYDIANDVMVIVGTGDGYFVVNWSPFPEKIFLDQNQSDSGHSTKLEIHQTTGNPFLSTC